ncbi:DUF11 domain-containing protein [Candidatus Saccharibacteria bacterium]|nr:DUF11 domain-containing protein [Candidatus Saccharibacteria bacterium]
MSMGKIWSGKSLRLSVGMSVLAVATALLLQAPKVGAQGAPTFQCDGTIYIAYNQTNTQLARLNVQNAPVDMTSIGGPYTQGYNAMGFNFNDGYIYGYNSTDEEYVRIAADGTAASIGAPVAGMPAGAPDYLAGDFDGDGYHNMLSAVGGGPLEWVVTDVSTPTPTLVGTFTLTNDLPGNMAVGDMAYNPKDGNFYGVDSVAHRVVMISVNATHTAGTVTHLSADNTSVYEPGSVLHGAAMIDAKGELLTTQLNPGKLFRSIIGTNGSGTGASTLVNDVPTVAQYDGAACPYAPLFEKSATPRTLKAGEQVTYTYTVYNALVSGPLTFTFSDVLTDNRTFVAGTLSNLHGGTASAYGGQGSVTVTGMSVPASSSITFNLTVQIPNDAPSKTMTNQAVINNFSVVSFPSELRSDDPTTVLAGDPTTITVQANPVPGTPDTGFGVITSNPLLFGGLLSLLAAGLVLLGRRMHPESARIKIQKK